MPKVTHHKHTNSRGVDYHLHARKQTLKGGREMTLHYFAKVPHPDHPGALPDTHEIVENAKTGLPMLKRKAPPAEPV